MIEEELPDELENDLDDIEPVGDESQLYEHFHIAPAFGTFDLREPGCPFTLLAAFEQHSSPPSVILSILTHACFS